MPKENVSVEVESSAYGLGKDLGIAVCDILQKKNAGVVLTDEMANLSEIIADAGTVSKDLADSKDAFMTGVALGIKAGLAPLFAPAAAAPAAATTA